MRFAALLLALALVAGCAGSRAYRDGNQLLNGGRIEDAPSEFDSLDWASLTIGEEWQEHGLAATRFVAHIPPPGDDGPVIVERFGSYYVVKDADLETWGLIWSGCAGLGAGS